MNILYLGTPESIHDLKWISFFSHNAENKVFLLTEDTLIQKRSSRISTFLNENHILLLGTIKPYSILKPLSVLRSIKKLRKICKEKNIDIVHALNAAPYAMWAYFTKTKYIITSRGTDVMETIPGLRQSGNKKLHLKILYIIFKRSFKKATFITSTSYKQVAKIKEMICLANVELVRTGVEVDIISKEIDKTNLPPQLQNCEYINSPRWIYGLYNSKTQARAILLLDDWILKKYTFVFYTKRDTPTDYLIEFEELLKKNIRIKYLIFEHLPQVNSLACIKFAALNIMIPDRDGTPNSALESMAARCPLIVGDFAYDDDLFTGTCMRLKENTPEALAESITKALTDYPAFYLEKAFQKVSEFGNRPLEMNKIKVLYKKMINK